MIDTHAHMGLKDEQKINGVDLVILSASNIEDSKENIKLSLSNNRLLPAVGIHPQEIVSDIRSQISDIEDLLIKNNNIVAVGECGMDFSEKENLNNENYKMNQETLFRGQICLSLKYNKPLIVHTREAAEDTLRILSDYKKLRGVIHCYSGGKKRVNKFLNLPGEWFLGIDGNLTYEDGLIEVIKNIPIDKLILETDSPYLTPVPHRGEKNYPEYIKFVYQKVAEIWGMNFKETEKIIDENAKRLFNII